MTSIKAVIFDMDGVIIDSEPIHYRVNQRLFKELMLDITEEEYNTFIGCSNSDMWGTLKDKYGLQEGVENLIAHQIEENINDLHNSNQKPISGIVELLDNLASENIKIGLASSSPMRYIEKVLEELALEKYFMIKVSGEDLENSKPNPDIYLKAASLIGESPEKCLAIEDSYNGVIAVKKAGMKCIGFNNVNSGNQDISQADIIIDSIEDITFDLLDSF